MSTVTITCPAGRITGVEKAGVNYFHSVDYAHFPSLYADAEPLPHAVDQDATTPQPDKVALTITTPAESRDNPVIIYVHGGGFEEGSHEDARTEGTANSRAGFVQVSIGYRTGLAGFAQFSEDDYAHFRGIDDCLLALEWVQKNIDSFGGDPTNVTLVGQSAGATIALWLARRDHYRGAFRRVLANSPAFPAEPFDARKATLRQALGKPVTRRSLESLPQEKVDKAYANFRKKFRYGLALGPAPLECAELADVPIVTLSTRDEFYDIPAGKKADNTGLRSIIGRYLAPKFDFSHNTYPEWLQFAKHLDSERIVGRMIGDGLIRRWVAAVAAEAPGETYMMELYRSSKRPALHCDDLPHFFGTIDTPAAAELNGWLHTFARTGDTGFPTYHPDHTVWEYDLDKAEGRVTYGSLDYVDAAFNVVI